MVKQKLDVDAELPASGDHDAEREGEDSDGTDNNEIVVSTDLDNYTLVDVRMVDEGMNYSTLNDDTEQGGLDVVGENSMTQVVVEDLESGKTDNMTDAIDCECRLHPTSFQRLLQQIRFRILNKDPSSTYPPKDRNDDDDDGTNSVRTDTTDATAIMIMRPSTSTETDNGMADPESLVDDEDVEIYSNSNLSNQTAAGRSNGHDGDDDDFIIVIPGPNSALRVSSPAHSYLFGRMGPCKSSSCCPIIMCIIACCAAGLIVVYFAFLPSNDIDE